MLINNACFSFIILLIEPQLAKSFVHTVYIVVISCFLKLFYRNRPSGPMLYIVLAKCFLELF